ncbi:MAG: N-acetylmuramoyl-L-alanine amidase [Bacteroidota bacterium]|nr:N-acetylmuramoyl-L-alanine amidase [Bacteroidota bacterium]
MAVCLLMFLSQAVSGQTYLWKDSASLLHRQLVVTTAPQSLVEIRIDRPATGIAIEYADKAEMKGSFAWDEQISYPVTHNSHVEHMAISDLILFPGPVTSFFLYNHSAMNPVTIHLIYAPEIQLEQLPAEALLGEDTTNCAKPPSVDQSVWRAGLPEPKGFVAYNDVEHIIVHHTATANSTTDHLQAVRNIYLYHTEVNGWDDVGYNYLIAQDGTIYNGRDGRGALDDDDTKGAHFCAKNDATMGISMIGTFNDGLPPDTALRALTQLMAWKINKDALNVMTVSMHPRNSPNATPLKTISGHRDGCPTECPGDSLFAIIGALSLEVEALSSACIPPANAGTGDHTESDISIYPQPAGNYIFIKTTFTEPYVCVLYDATGRQLKSGILNSDVSWLSLEGLPAGIYFLEVRTDKEWVKTLVVKG